MVKRDQQSDLPRRQGYPSAPGRRKINDRFTATHSSLSSYLPTQILHRWTMSPTVCVTQSTACRQTVCACLEIPSTGNRPMGMLAKNTLHHHLMEVLFLESHKSTVQYGPGYTRDMPVCSGPFYLRLHTTEAMSAGRPCLTFFFF